MDWVKNYDYAYVPSGYFMDYPERNLFRKARHGGMHCSIHLSMNDGLMSFIDNVRSKLYHDENAPVELKPWQAFQKPGLEALTAGTINTNGKRAVRIQLKFADAQVVDDGNTIKLMRLRVEIHAQVVMADMGDHEKFTMEYKSWFSPKMEFAEHQESTKLIRWLQLTLGETLSHEDAVEFVNKTQTPVTL